MLLFLLSGLISLVFQGLEQLFPFLYIAISKDCNGPPVSPGPIYLAAGDLEEIGNLDKCFEFIAHQVWVKLALHLRILVHHLPQGLKVT